MDATLTQQPIASSTEQPVRKGGGNKGLEQAYILRDIAANQFLALKDEPAPTLAEKGIRARALRDVCSVWTSADDRIRIKRGQPLPGSLRPEKPKSRSTKQPLQPLDSLPET